MTTQDIDQAKAEAFGGQLIGHLNSAATALGLSVGHRTGLFDAMAGLSPSTSQQVADAAGLHECYGREWLNGMVTGGVVEYDRDSQAYSLPPEHAMSLTRAAGPGNLASMGQFIPMLGNVEDELVDAFANGGGVPYSSYGSFHTLMAGNSAERFDHNLVDVQIPLVPGIAERLEAGIDVADLGCGSGHAINLMAQQWPNSRFTGFDFSEEGIAAAIAEAAELGLENASFEVQDIPKMSGADQFDLITTFDAVHDQADPAGFLSVASSLLRSGGDYLCADIAASSDVADNIEHPIGPLGYAMSLFHCMTVSLALDGVGLGSMWGEQKALEMLGEAGFASVDVRRVEGDILNNFYICSKG
ncbi:MAG: methyltransferase domain-containing protein [Dehalococcoidia bacterium]